MNIYILTETTNDKTDELINKIKDEYPATTLELINKESVESLKNAKVDRKD